MSSNPELSVPRNPDFTVDPAPHSPPAGDWRDDDGTALASYFLHNDPGPALSQLVQALVNALPVPTGTKDNPMGNRIITRRYLFTSANGDQAIMALPPDDNRRSVSISVSPVGANAGIYIASDSFNVLDNADNAGSHTAAFKLEKNNAPFTIDDYTGPLWICGATLDGVTVSRCDIMAVTA